MDGVEVTPRLKADPVTRSTRIIVLTDTCLMMLVAARSKPAPMSSARNRAFQPTSPQQSSVTCRGNRAGEKCQIQAARGRGPQAVGESASAARSAQC